MTSESIIDFPKETLSPNVWTQQTDGKYVLRDDVKQKLMAVIEWAKKTFKMPQMSARVIGSITSNCYSSDSDIDLHFSSPKLKAGKADEFNTLLKDAFKKLVEKHPELGRINDVEVEVFMQENPWFDMMSVGCYDVLRDEWIVGPEMIDLDFDPYAEYFMKDMKLMDDVIADVRSIVLQMYELSIALLKSKDEEFKARIRSRLQNAMKKAMAMLEVLKSRRNRNIVPKNAEDAAKGRESREWKKLDSAFKLLGKFGYLSILKQASHAVKHGTPVDEAAQQLMQTIDERISSKSLVDSEHTLRAQSMIDEDDALDESSGQYVKLMAIAALMAIRGVLPASALAAQLSRAHAKAEASKQSFTVNSPDVKKAIDAASVDNRQIGSLSRTNLVNMLTRVLWREARAEPEAGIEAIASVIWNRADHDPENFAAVLRQPGAFTSLAKYPKDGWSNAGYRWFQAFTSTKDINAKDQQALDFCEQTAVRLVDQDFTSTIGSMNSYLNKDKAEKSAVDSWGKSCTKKIGSHHFGYLREHDPKYVLPGTMAPRAKTAAQKKPVHIVVKANDTLSGIAKRHSTTVKKLMKLNKLKSPDKIRAGQTIRVA